MFLFLVLFFEKINPSLFCLLETSLFCNHFQRTRSISCIEHKWPLNTYPLLSFLKLELILLLQPLLVALCERKQPSVCAVNVNERRIRKWNSVPFVNYADPFPVNLDLFQRLQALQELGELKYNFLFHIVPTQYFIHPSLFSGYDAPNSLHFVLFRQRLTYCYFV